nr:hypothetical protein [Ktedonospora formicarum]
MQDMNSVLTEKRKIFLEGWMAYQIHFETRNCNNWRRPSPKGFTQDICGQRIANTLCPLIDRIEGGRHNQYSIGFGKRISLSW